MFVVESYKVTVDQALLVIEWHMALNRINHSYLGKTGCACGCRGKTIEGMKGLKLRMKKASAIENAEAEVVIYADGTGIVAIENDDKTMFVEIKDMSLDFSFLKEAV